METENETAIDRQAIQNDCIRVLHQQLQDGPANIQVASAKELLSLLNSKDHLEKKDTGKVQPLFGDIFKWRKMKEK